MLYVVTILGEGEGVKLTNGRLYRAQWSCHEIVDLKAKSLTSHF